MPKKSIKLQANHPIIQLILTKNATYYDTLIHSESLQNIRLNNPFNLFIGENHQFNAVKGQDLKGVLSPILFSIDNPIRALLDLIRIQNPVRD